MNKLELDKYIKLIKNFEQSDILITFLIGYLKAGSTLFQSMLDSHKEILMLPVILYYYLDWETIFEKNINNAYQLTKEIVNLKYLSKEGLKTFYPNGLGLNKEELVDFDLEDFGLILFNILEKLDLINRKNLLLSIHLAYAKLKNIDIDNIKVIFVHQHITSNLFQLNFSNINVLYNTFSTLETKSYFCQHVFKDFPKAKIIVNIRNPYQEPYKSIKKISENINNSNLINFFSTLISYLKNKNDYTKVEQQSKFFILIKFEELHNNTIKTLELVSTFLNISFSEKMLNLTIDGKTFWGNNPKNITDKTNPNISELIELESFSEDNTLLLGLFQKIADDLNYKQLSNNSILFKLEYIEKPLKLEFENYLALVFYFLDSINEANKSFIENYFYYRKLLFTKMLYLDSKICSIDKSIIINELKLIFNINSFYYDESIPNDNYIISINNTNKKLNSENIYYLNSVVDQIWVSCNFAKNTYIELGINPEKIEVIPPFVYSHFTENMNKNENKIFQFLYIGRNNEDTNLELLITAYFEEFNDKENVRLYILLKNDLDKKFDINLINLVSQYNKKLDLKVEYLDINTTNTIKLFEDSACFVYPNTNEIVAQDVLNAFSKGIPVITPKSGIFEEFFTEDFCYLIENTSNNNVLEPSKESLKKIMRNVFQNKNEARIKVKKAKEFILNNFTLENTMDKVLIATEKLKNKKVFRSCFDEFSMKLLEKAKNSYNKSNFTEAKNLFYELYKYYDKKYENLFYFSLAQIKCHDFENALDNLYECIEAGIECYNVFYNFALCLEKLEEVEEAETFYKKAINFKVKYSLE